MKVSLVPLGFTIHIHYLEDSWDFNTISHIANRQNRRLPNKFFNTELKCFNTLIVGNRIQKAYNTLPYTKKYDIS